MIKPLFLFLATMLLAFDRELSAQTPELAAKTDTQVQYLSGHGSDDAVEWDFFCSDGQKSGTWSKIRVPSCWELQGYGTYNYGMPFYGKANPPGIAREEGKYRFDLKVPAAWHERRIRLVFEGSMTDTHVRINGVSAGPAHQGAFYRFKYEITPILKFGATNQIEVTVDKESSNESVNMAERRADYWNFGGIFRPVFLEILPVQFIDRVAIDAEADGDFSAEVFLSEGADPTATVSAQIVDAKDAPVGAVMEARSVPGGDRLTLHTHVEGPKQWTGETPNLYRVRFTLSNKSGVQHTLVERFGFRTFEVRAGVGIFLNGQRLLLKGVNRHSFWPETGRTLSRERNYADVKLIREMNMNAVRMSHYPPDPEFLEACDELGLYVLDELGGWHGAYDTGVGRSLVGEMVRRDVNHPSILFWDNGNEGGWNTELDGEFAKWDPQHRPVLHPQKKLSGIDTMHYRSYGEMQEFFRAPDLFMPTEFLHGLYDGGLGAGLWDYWEMMRQHPRAAGGFLWVFADEGVVRTDQGGRVDNAGSYAPDGIVGPHHEKEGSFNTIRQVWSPVQVGPNTLPDGFSGTLSLENRYDFISLDQCKFAWSLANFASPQENHDGHTVVASGEIGGPSIAPHAAGELKLPLPEHWRDADVLYVAVKNPAGELIWTWSWSWKKNADLVHPPATTPANASALKIETHEEAGQVVVTSGALELRFDKTSGELASVHRGGKAFSLNHGPRFVAVRRGDRTLDGTIDPAAAKGMDRVYKDISEQSRLTSLVAKAEGEDVVVEANYFGSMRQARWRISGHGDVRLDYEYAYEGVVELMGVQFNYPETNMKSIRWLGRGPYRVWQNRIHGTTLDVWQNAYNDTIPGETFVYPEFKGYFRDWRWATFETTEGAITLTNDAGGPFLGVYSPRDGRDAQLFTLPPIGLAALDVIPAIRNKVNTTDLVGPSSQAQHVSGVHRGTLQFRFETH